MKFVCDRCNTRYSISDDKVRGKVLKIRCKTCGGLIPVNGKALDAPPAPDPDRTVMSAMPLPPEALREPDPPPPIPAADRTVMSAMPLPPEALPTPTPNPQVKIEWHVSVDGKTKGPLNIDHLIDEVAPLPATAEIHLWNEEMDDWMPLPEVSGIWRLVQHRRRVLAAPPKPPRIPTPPPLPIPPPIPREAARTAAGAGPARAKRSATPGNELLLKPVSGVIGGGRGSAEDEPTPVPVGPKVVPAPEVMVMGPPQRVSASRAAVKSAPLPSPDDYPPTPPPSVKAPAARSTAQPFAAVGSGSAPAPFAAAPLPSPVEPFAVGAPAPAPGPGPVHIGTAVPAVTPFFPEAQPPRAEISDSGLMPKARLIRRQRVMKYIIGLLVAVVIVTAVVAWNAIRNKEVRTVVVERPTAERKLSPEELAERLAMVGGPEQPRPAPGQQPRQPAKPVAPKPATPRPAPKPGAPAPSGPVDQAAAARFAQSDELRLPAGGIASGGGAARSAGGVSQDAIMRVVNANKNGIKTCYQRALLRDKTLVQGKISVRLAIGLSGRVKSVTISGPPEFRILEPCIKDVVHRWAFPASSDEYGAEFPFVFQGSE